MIDIGFNKHAKRMLTGLIFGTIVMLSIIIGDIALLCLLAVILAYASKEYVKILNHKGFYPSLSVIYFTEAILAAVVYFERFDLVACTLTICAMCSFAWVLFVGRQPYIANVATTMLGMVYCGWFPLHLMFLRNLSGNGYDSGLGFVVLMIMSVIATDVGCYYVGTRFGKNKLAPTVSPNKTIEGAIGGALFSVVMAVVIGMYLGLSFIMAVLAGIICTIFAQIGDLCESLLKRDAGVKDSGDTLPGHGGFLDRTDSYAFTIPIMYYFCKFFIFKTDWMSSFTDFLKGLF